MMVVKINRIIKYFGIIVIFSFLLPAIKLGGFGMKLDLIFLFPLLFFVLLVDRKVKTLSIFRKLIIITFLLFLNMIASDNLGLFYFNQETDFHFATEFIQVFNRVTVFYCFFYISYNQIISSVKFNKYLSFIFLTALFFGFLQSFDVPVVKDLSKLYALTDTQIKGFESVNQRGFGVAGNILTWGGISGFLFYYFYYLSESKIVRLIGSSLALINISFSVSRTAIISLGISFVLINLIIVLLVKKDLRSFLKFLSIIVFTFFIVIFSFITFFPERYELMIMRFSYMDEALNETGRGAQRDFFIEFMNMDYWNYFIGIGKPVLDGLGYMEMEPIFLMVAYGIIGCILHYLLIYFSLNKVFKIKKRDEKMFAFIGGATIFYMIFSVGFYFMREAYSGMIYWILMGYFIGGIYINKDEKYI